MIKNSSILSSGLLLCLLSAMLGGCALMPDSGPNRQQIHRMKQSPGLEGLLIKPLDDALARKLWESKRSKTFSAVFGNAGPQEYRIGAGDTLVISVWETPPSILFGSATLNSRTGTLNTTSAEALPTQMVMNDGTVNIPFVGRVQVAKRTVREVEREITRRLQGKANDPQVLVRVSGSPTFQVSVLGDVAKSANINLTPKGERLLDALASVGGVTQPVTKVSLQLSRANVSASMPLDAIVHDPEQNIPLRPGDVLTALFQPWTFSVLGAAGRNQEIPFEARGITLAQALARSGGLDDNRADPAGVFIFRFENADLLAEGQAPVQSVNGKIPVVYQVNFKDPAAFFVTQHFPMQDKDILYVANMPSAELTKFLRMIGMVVSPSLSIANTTNNLSQ